MTREEAKEFLIGVSYEIGTVGAECLSEKDAEKMREAIEALSEPITTGQHCCECGKPVPSAWEMTRTGYPGCEPYVVRIADSISREEVLKVINNPLNIRLVPSVRPEPCEDCISRREAIYLADEMKYDLPDDERLADLAISHNEAILDYQTKLSLLPSVRPVKNDKFIQFVTDEIFDENWEYNAGAFAELACRRLAKMGYVRENGDKWEKVECDDCKQRWIDKSKPGDEYDFYECPECGCQVEEEYPFCPWCGAKMVEAESEE